MCLTTCTLLAVVHVWVDCICLFCVAVFAPSVINLVDGAVTSTSIDIRWSLPYPTVPTRYNISYTYAELYGTNPNQRSAVLLVDHTDVTENGGVSPVVYNYTLVDLLAFSEYNVSLVAVYGEGDASQLVSLNRLMTSQGGGWLAAVMFMNGLKIFCLIIATCTWWTRVVAYRLGASQTPTFLMVVNL